MDALQFETLSEFKPHEEPRLFPVTGLRNLSDRTLLYGYNTDRDTYHFYLMGGEFHLVYYSYQATKPLVHQRSTAVNIDKIIPNKRLYPEACDYEFCLMLASRGVHLPFTVFNPHRPAVERFVGKIHTDFGIAA